jgi:hypothetical protein
LVTGLVMAATGLGTAYHASRLSDGGHSVARMLGGVPVDRTAGDRGERRLVNVAEEMAIAAGLPVPALYVLPATARSMPSRPGSRPTGASSP